MRTKEVHLGKHSLYLGWREGFSTNSGESSNIYFRNKALLSVGTSTDYTTTQLQTTFELEPTGASFKWSGVAKATLTSAGALSTTTSITSPIISGSTYITTPIILTPAGGTLEFKDTNSSGTVSFDSVQTKFYKSANFGAALKITSNLDNNALVPVEVYSLNDVLRVDSKNGHIFRLDAFSDFPNSPLPSVSAYSRLMLVQVQTTTT